MKEKKLKHYKKLKRIFKQFLKEEYLPCMIRARKMQLQYIDEKIKEYSKK